MIRIRKGYVIAVVIAIAVLICIVITRGGKSLETTAPTATDTVIIIDPGHGGIDGGAVGVNGTVEKRINLEVALKLREVFEAAGFTVIMTRETDISIHDSDADTVREMKVSDLHNRLALTELYPDSLLISIHQNTLGSQSVTGAQVFFSPNDPSSQILAQCLQDQFNRYVQLDGDREIKKAGKNLYLFYNAQNTAVLAECGFLSNAEEEALLCSEEHQKKLVYCLFKGTLEYFELAENTQQQAA